MEFCGDDLIFSLDESKALANILNHYILELDATEEPFEELELRNYWDRAANLNLATMMLWMGGADVTREKVARFINPLASEPVNDQGEDVGLTFAALQARCLELPGSRPALVKAFRWAGSHMVEGSVVIQNEVGAILNSGYEDNAISQAFGSSNKKLAQRRARSMIDSGDQARRWLEQLGEAST